MTATATERRLEDLGGAAHTARHGVLKVLRGASWKRGWLLVAHGLYGTGDRLMPYPTGGFDSAVTAANGGPLQVPGADANGGLRIIAKKANVTVAVANAAALAVSVSFSALTGYAITLNPILASTTATAIVSAVRAHGLANSLIDLNYTGTGAGLSAALSGTAVPYVRIAGIAGGEAANDDAAADATIVHGSTCEQVFKGRFGFLFNATAVPWAVQPPQHVFAVDNQTVEAEPIPLCLPMWCSSYEDDLAICEIK